MTDQEIKDWQDRFTFECPDIEIGSSRITPEQCEANRNRYGGWDSGSTTPAKIPACMKCTKYEERIATVKERRNLQEAKPMMMRGICEACLQGPQKLTNGLCDQCKEHKEDGNLIHEGDGWDWLIPVPAYVKGQEEASAEPVLAGPPACAGCNRDTVKIVSRGLCGSCYAHTRRGNLIDNGDGTFTWKGDPPEYAQEAVVAKEEESVKGALAGAHKPKSVNTSPDSVDEKAESVDKSAESVDIPTAREIDEARHGVPQEPVERAQINTCEHCHCPDKCPYINESPLGPEPAATGEPRVYLSNPLSADKWEPDGEPIPIGIDPAKPGTYQSVMSIGGIPLTRHVTRRGGGTMPFASVRCGEKSIEVALNSAAVVEFGLKGVKYVDVYKSVEGKVLALVPLDEPKDSSSVQLRTANGENTRIVSATAALREMGIEENGRYSVRQESGVVVVDLKEKAA